MSKFTPPIQKVKCGPKQTILNLDYIQFLNVYYYYYYYIIVTYLYRPKKIKNCRISGELEPLSLMQH